MGCVGLALNLVSIFFLHGTFLSFSDSEWRFQANGFNPEHGHNAHHDHHDKSDIRSTNPDVEKEGEGSTSEISKVWLLALGDFTVAYYI